MTKTSASKSSKKSPKKSASHQVNESLAESSNSNTEIESPLDTLSSTNSEHPKVQIHVANFGVITLELDAALAPATVTNFLSYVKDGHYTNTIFHRVIEGFMIQGGGFNADMKEVKSGSPIQNEAANGLKNEHYTIAMARTSDPHSATAQFFINTHNNAFLNHTSPSPSGWGYAVFGKVTDGQSVVDAINVVATGRRGFHDDVPKETVLIEKITQI
jgi:peptidyl-prolyl cis-trans isomerase B (cyclophilin B)